ncbi:MAG: ABC-F family ATP-binding cassette domain-containing protein [Parachlamydiales bacterium]
MTVLLTCNAVSKAHSHTVLFESLTITVNRGDRTGIIGPNGAGKSTLIRMIAGEEKPDTGEIVSRQSIRIGYVPQIAHYPEKDVLQTVIDVLVAAHYLHTDEERSLAAEVILTKMGFTDMSEIASKLSGGWKKRLDLARALVLDPDVLLLDEPTNHLDIASIVWLENLLLRSKITFILISHDRLFLERVTNRIIELNRAFPKGQFSVDGNYAEFLERRADFLTSLEQYEQGLRSKVRNEVAWLRQSPSARTTKQQARINQAHALQGELQSLKAIKTRPKEEWQFDNAGLQSRRMVSAKNLAKTLDGKQLFKNLDVLLSPGVRLGIAGDNGSGKTTLLRILAGELEPDQGNVKYADGIRIVYFDQHREKLDDNQTLKDCLAPNGDMLEYRGKPIHVNGWARRFHFKQERMLMPVGQLSGGERARILLARLMLQPADVLLLDEPTNDLDIETLEVLEESLLEFPGAVVLITHDRRMLDNVSTQIIGLGCQEEEYYFADVDQWEKAKQRARTKSMKSAQVKPVEELPKKPVKSKLSYKDQQELTAISGKIEAAEKEVARLEGLSEDLTVQADLKQLEQICNALSAAHKQVDSLYHRWQELDNL